MARGTGRTSRGPESRVAVFSTENQVNIPVYPLDVFVATEAGTAQLRGGATRLPAEALALLVLLDGKTNVGDLEQKASHIAPEALRGAIRSLLAAGMVRAATIAETDGLDFSAFFESTTPDDEPSIGAQQSASREADSGTPILERDGYYVSIARQAVTARTPAPGERLAAFVIEDDPDVATLVSRLLEREAFAVSVAASRDTVLARLRTAPLPDVVILDVQLPDVNGFDILQNMKKHPVLKAIPVIMLTAEAKPESVTRGLVAGADGYITKPFDSAALLAGVKAVLGLA